jgi:hypothetical protein
MLNSCVALRFKILTYYRVRSAFETSRALLLNIIWHSKTDFKPIFEDKDINRNEVIKFK